MRLPLVWIILYYYVLNMTILVVLCIIGTSSWYTAYQLYLRAKYNQSGQKKNKIYKEISEFSYKHLWFISEATKEKLQPTWNKGLPIARHTSFWQIWWFFHLCKSESCPLFHWNKQKIQLHKIFSFCNQNILGTKCITFWIFTT